MARAKQVKIEDYPRIKDGSNDSNLLDDTRLISHSNRLSIDELKLIIQSSIEFANSKSSREISFEFAGNNDEEREVKYIKEANELFSYFIRYCGDPASTAFDLTNKHYKEVAWDSFRSRVLQMERMNSGWRYQSIAKEAAARANRFEDVSHLNLQEADFVATVRYSDSNARLNIYVSVKNRSNTMGGQDWPKAIEAIEGVASRDKNRNGNYICVFGIAMEKGERYIKVNSKTKNPYSFNTEVWLSDYFWPFFSNYSYEEISKAVLEVLIATGKKSSLNIDIPERVFEYFGKICSLNSLTDESGCFNQPVKLVELFCNRNITKIEIPKKRRPKKSISVLDVKIS